MIKSILIAGLVCTWLIGCSGGGGGGGGNNTSGGIPTEENRARAFRDEALRLANVEAIVECKTVVCSIADSQDEAELDDGVVVAGCSWRCLESMIDDSGETRNYWIILNWQRLPDGCFGPEIVVFAQESPILCVPNQERF